VEDSTGIFMAKKEYMGKGQLGGNKSKEFSGRSVGIKRTLHSETVRQEKRSGDASQIPAIGRREISCGASVGREESWVALGERRSSQHSLTLSPKEI